MHYYSFHIGDYRAATAHLSNEEDLAFRRLLDMYYDTEQPIPLDTQWVARRLRVDIDTLVSVLNDMFLHTENGWTHSRCDAEISHYHELAQRNRENGKKGGRPKKPSGLPVESQSEPKETLTTNQEPITNNHKPKKESATVVARPLDVSEQVWQDWLALRKAKKAAVTQTVLEGARKEAFKLDWPLEKFLIEWCTRGSQGLKAEWIAPKPTFAQQAADIARVTVPGSTDPDPALLKIQQDRLKAVPPSLEQLERMAELRRSMTK